MEEAKVLVEELKELMPKMDEQSEKRIGEITQWFKEHRSEENDALLRTFMEEGVTEVGAEIADIRRQIADEDYRLLPLSYIARKYFGKSHAWLSQRINGTKVRGHVYTLNDEQKQVFNNAMQDLSKFYGSFRLA
ncbi:MAG: DUF5053 domain-containing protein [Prevotella sp.]|nr:DUF5053 domain-containing protein [Prevotella sp.]